MDPNFGRRRAGSNRVGARRGRERLDRQLRPGTDEWAHALGYFLGHRIARAYYERAESKEAAIVDLIRLQDPEHILEASRYAERFDE